MMSRFRPIDRDTAFLLPPSVQEWLPEGHLARYVVDVVEGLDLSELERAYAGRGSDAYHPAMLLSLLIYGYATGTFSSRKIERATYDSLAFRYIACNLHPDHDTLASFRQRFGKQFESAFVQVLQVARENQLSRFGTVSLDGTKIHANASRHSALSYGHAEKIEARLKAEVQELLKLAEAADQTPIPDGMKLAGGDASGAKIVWPPLPRPRPRSRPAPRSASSTSRPNIKPRSRPAKPRQPPRASSPKVRHRSHPRQARALTTRSTSPMRSPGSCRMSGGGFEQSYNAQAMVDNASMLVLVAHVTQATNDKQQLQPMLEQLQALPAGLNSPETLSADTGYYSEKNVTACQDAKIEPLIAVKREEHHPDWKQRFSEPQPLPEGATPVETMKHRLKTRAGKAAYALRKQTVEPVFGILKSVMGFRQFLLRGLENVRNEWTLVCLAWNLKRMAVLRP